MDDTLSPGYVRIHKSGELRRRVATAVEGLASCQTCPRRCKVNRLGNETRACGVGRYARVSSCFPHFGEEDCLRGSHGSGTIFFAQCNLHCVFCQNYDISHRGAGSEVEPEQLARMMLELQLVGCHNINFVTPTHVAPQMLEAAALAIDDGLRLPIVYNSGGYDAVESLRLLEGVVDIYMPDFKFWSDDVAGLYLECDDYPETVRTALREMHRQVGDLTLDERGIARRGVLVRHLVMPDLLGETREIMRFLAEEVSSGTYVNIMDQYHPAGKVRHESYAEINRRVSIEEVGEAYGLAREAGLHRFAARWPGLGDR